METPFGNRQESPQLKAISLALTGTLVWLFCRVVSLLLFPLPYYHKQMQMIKSLAVKSSGRARLKGLHDLQPLLPQGSQAGLHFLEQLMKD